MKSVPHICPTEAGKWGENAGNHRPNKKRKPRFLSIVGKWREGPEPIAKVEVAGSNPVSRSIQVSENPRLTRPAGARFLFAMLHSLSNGSRLRVVVLSEGTVVEALLSGVAAGLATLSLAGFSW